MPARAIFLDLDGSSLDHDHRLPQDLVDLIATAPDVHWSILTGRSHRAVRWLDILHHFPAEALHCFDNGATIMRRDGERALSVPVDEARLTSVLADIRAEIDGMDYLYAVGQHTPGLVWVDGPPTDEMRYWGLVLDDFEAFAERALADPITKLTIKAKAVDWPGRMMARGHAVNGHHVDVSGPGISKASAAEFVLARHGLPPERAVFVFNDYNDLPVLASERLRGLVRVKVGPVMPEVEADHRLAHPREVAATLAAILASDAAVQAADAAIPAADAREPAGSTGNR